MSDATFADRNRTQIVAGDRVDHRRRGWVDAPILEINQWSDWHGRHADLVVDLPGGREAVPATLEGAAFVFDVALSAQPDQPSTGGTDE
jgi:hypothetical protein